MRVEDMDLSQLLETFEDLVYWSEHAQGSNMERTYNGVIGEFSGHEYQPNDKGHHPVSLYSRREAVALGGLIEQKSEELGEGVSDELARRIRRMRRFMLMKENRMGLLEATE